MKITKPKWVKKANQWCVTTIKNNDSKTSSKHAVTQTLYWFSSEEEAIAKVNELNAANHNNG